MTKYFWPIFWISAAALRFVALAAVPLWYDEVFTYRLAHLTYANMAMASAADVHPPLYYFLIWMLYHLFPSAPDWASRLPSALASLGSLWLFWQVLKAYDFPAPVKYGALILMGLNPFQLHYAIEARMYAVLQFAWLFGVWMVQRRSWPAVGLSIAALAYLHNYGLFYSAVLWVYAIYRRPADWRPVTLTAAGAALAWLAWLPSFLFQLGWTRTYGYWITDASIGDLLYIVQNLFGGYYITAPFGLALPVAVYIAILAGMLAGRKLPGMSEIWLLAWGVIGIAFFISLVSTPVLLFRAFIGASPFLLLIIASTFPHILPRRGLSYAVILLYGPIVTASLYGFFVLFAANGKEDITATKMLAWMQTHYQTGDLVLSITDGPITMLMMYAPDVEVYKLDVGVYCDPRGAISVPARRFMGYIERTWNELPTGRRVWIVNGASVMSKDCEIEQVRAIIGDTSPVTMLQDDKFVQVGIWEVQR